MVAFDPEAERAALDCLLSGATSDDLDPAHFANEGRRALCLALDLLRWCGPWATPATCHPRDLTTARARNAEAAADAVLQADIWRSAGDPRHELLIECWGMAGGQPERLSYWLDRLRDAYTLRVAAEIGNAMVRAALRGDVARLKEVLAC